MNNIEIFDKNILRVKELRANRDDVLVHAATEILDEKLGDIKRNFISVLELSRNDEVLKTQENTYDLIKSTLAMHWVNDVFGLLTQIKFALKPDGLFIANFFGGECLKELKTAFTEADNNSISPRISPFIDVRDAGLLLQKAGFAMPVVDVEKIEVSYKDAFALMHHLRKIGETNSLIRRKKNFTTRSFMNKVNENYAKNFSDAEGRVTATFEIITMTGWKPHPSQQKPLRPGTGEISLEKLL